MAGENGQLLKRAGMNLLVSSEITVGSSTIFKRNSNQPDSVYMSVHQ
jgi:hypothetical protein